MVRYDLPESEESRNAAMRRRSYTCPVIKAASEALNHEQAISTYHALEIVKRSVSRLPEGAATADLLSRVLGVEIGK